jgi:hypothetical protein
MACIQDWAIIAMRCQGPERMSHVLTPSATKLHIEDIDVMEACD